MKENWKSIKGFEGLYEVSDLGNVRSLKFGKIKVLKPRLKSKGYLDVELCKNGKRKKFYVHRLGYEAFKGPIPSDMTVDHINGVKADNRLENLQLLSVADNVRKACNKQLDLMEADWPYRELTFASAVEASVFFSYKDESQIGNYISYARKRGRNFINLRKKKYFFAQEA